MEWRQKHAIGGLFLYVFGAGFLTYLSFKKVSPLTWMSLYWIIILFAAVTAVGRSFIQHGRGKMLFYYTLTSSLPFLLAKMAWNLVLLWCISLLTMLCFAIFHGWPVQDTPIFLSAVALGTLGLSSTLTTVSAISYRANNPFTLMAVLSFPVMIPVLSIVLKLSKNAIDGLDPSISFDKIITLIAIDLLSIAVSCLLFPYLWRD
jgi:heme exporter protein B